MKDRNKKIREIIKDGILDLSGFKLPCYVLDDETRGFSGREMQEALGMVDEGDKKVSGKRLVRHLEQKSLKPFVNKAKSLVHFEPIIYCKGRKKFHIYDANLLPEMCIIFLELEREAIANKTSQNRGPSQNSTWSICQNWYGSFNGGSYWLSIRKRKKCITKKMNSLV